MFNQIHRCPKKPSNLEVEDGSRAIDAPHYLDQDISRREHSHAIILHEYPLSIVDRAGFRKFVSSLQPLFKMVLRNTIKNDILKILDNLKSKTSKLLETLRSRIAITTDMWTSDNNKKGFMAIKAHFIDDSWRLQCHILRFVHVPAPHEKYTLCGALLSCLLEWNLERRISTIRVDNCSTNNAMMKTLLDEKLCKRDLLLMGRMFHVRCTAHILNLIVQEGLKVIADSIKNVRDSVLYLIGSSGRIESDRIQRCILELSLSDANYRCFPTEEQWSEEEDVCDKWKLFYHINEQLSGIQYHTSSQYFSKVCEVKLELELCVKSFNPLISNMVVAMLEKFKKYWDDMHIFMGVAAIFYPIYKMKFAEFYLPLIYGEEDLTKIQKVRTHCHDLFQDYKSKIFAPHESVEVSSSNEAINLLEGDQLSSFDRFVPASSSANTVARSELDMYLQESLWPQTPSFDNLSWWKINGLKFPTLQKMARALLAIPISTVASELAFSTSRRLISPHRSRLHPTTLEALMCARTWLWNEINGLTSSIDKVSCPALLDEEEEPDSNLENFASVLG